MALVHVFKAPPAPLVVAVLVVFLFTVVKLSKLGGGLRAILLGRLPFLSSGICIL